MRGYAALRRDDRLTFLSGVMAALTTRRLDAARGRPSPTIYGAAYGHAEIATRQYLLIRVMGSIALNSAMLRSIGSGGAPIAHPLPAEWRDAVAAQGVAVARFRSACAWWAFAVGIWVYGLLAIARHVWHGLVETLSPRWDVPAPYVYFVALAPGNLPRPAADGRSHDVVTWYCQWTGRSRALAALAHSVPGAPATHVEGIPIVKLPSPVPPPSGAALARYVAWALRAVGRTIVDMATGRWWNPVMLAEASHAAALSVQSDPRLAAEYMFHGSNVIYRPLWSYEAAARGSASTFYFYSTNSEAFKRADGYTTPLHSWQVMTWPRILVWNEWQEAFVRRAIGDAACVDIVGPIWFHSSPKELPELPSGAIAVFDVQPQRTSRFRQLAVPHEFYTARVASAFLRDVYAAAAANGRAIAFKRKRHIGPMMHRGYGRTVGRLAQMSSFISVDPDISAARVIEKCDAVISMPFTSTALLGREAGKPSIYYDPLSYLQKDDRAAHGVPIVTGLDELRRWFADLSREIVLTRSEPS